MNNYDNLLLNLNGKKISLTSVVSISRPRKNEVFWIHDGLTKQDNVDYLNDIDTHDNNATILLDGSIYRGFIVSWAINSISKSSAKIQIDFYVKEIIPLHGEHNDYIS